jgi:hypothetical protein
MADDEGLLRWTVAYIKANAFMYDDDLGVDQVTALMAELTKAGLVLAYTGGKARQSLGWVVQFARHQKPNRPQPSKLPPPSIQNGAVIQGYVRRDANTCHLCGHECSTDHDKPRLWPSLDHIEPRSDGGSDYPSNIRLSHVSCNKARRDRPAEECEGSAAVLRSVSQAVNDSGSDSPPVGSSSGGDFVGEVVGSGATAPSADLLPLRRDVDQLCERLVTRMVENGCKKPTITDRWRDSARLLLDRDKRDLHEALTLIDWSQSDDFWRANVQSMPTFREQYDRLRLQSQRAGPSSTLTRQLDDAMRRAEAAEAQQSRKALP